ncbi:MAG: DMT family transporter [Candidatus Delongbacteria bacterium]|jgi:drug/metabolite transporter (DMT)-like permease|nr:DMT family transporter [Candidatus Delongbacteria bacterium]
MKDRTKALTFILTSTLSFSFMGAFVKALGDFPVAEKVFFRNTISMIIAFMVLSFSYKYSVQRKKGYLRLIFGKMENQKFLLIRSVFGLLGVAFHFYALSKLYLADSQMLNRTSPIFVSLFAFLFLKEKLSKLQMSTIFIALIGAVMVIKPKFDYSMLPALGAFGAAIMAGAAYTFVRFLRDKEKPETIIFYFSLFSMVGSLPFMIPTFIYPNSEQWMMLLGVGLTASIGQIGLTHAYRYAKASEVSIYTYTGIIFSALIGYFLWDEISDITSIIGGLIIILSAVTVFYHNNRKDRINPV